MNKPVAPAGLFGQTASRLTEGSALTLASVPEGFDAFVVAEIALALAKAGEERAVALCFVARDGQRAQSFIDALAFAAPGLFVPVYGPGSAARFAALGPSRRVEAPNLIDDVDTVADLVRLQERLGPCTSSVLASLRLGAAA